MQRLKINLEEADREVAGVVSKLARVRAYERDLLVDEKVMTEKRDGLARIYKVKVRALFDLEQDGGF